MTSKPDGHSGLEIAIIGMACRFPGAPDIDAYWRNLRQGTEQVRRFGDEELLAEGTPAWLLGNPNFVKAGSVVDDIDRFDPSFFGINPREAEIMDPQHRLFLQCAWEAMECAGYHVDGFRGPVGVFAGAGMNTYALNNLYPHPRLIAEVGAYKINISNSWEYLATLVSYKLNLRGPSVNVQTACSTSLAAVHLACQSLLTGESDMAIAGGVQVASEGKSGYLFQEGMIHSPDGHCRAFDASAQGTVPGNGLGVVVLRRLADALDHGDAIRAVIRGSSLNNDGSAKVGFTAPSELGQEQVIRETLATSGVPADSIGFVEAHGTGTPLGDPIETAALTRAFRQTTQRSGFCALGSVKTNFGHLGAAAGVAGLIKLVLSLENRKIPPSLHFQKANPKCNLESSPFFVNSKLAEWPAAATGPRRGSVSSFGIGGTNAHAILEEAPGQKPRRGEPRPGYLVLSARTETALDALAARLAAWLEARPESDLGDVAFTLRAGRKQFEHRRVVFCNDMAEALADLKGREGYQTADAVVEKPPRLAFLFPGQGSQYPGMARELYGSEPVFKKALDRCIDGLKPQLEADLLGILFPQDDSLQAAALLRKTLYAQPAIFAVNWALAQLWDSWGIGPHAMLGHSIGEYVAACLAGVFSLEQALALVAYRAKAMNDLPKGAMMAVTLSEAELSPLMGGALEIAAVNGTQSTVVSGPPEPVTVLRRNLAEKGVPCRMLEVSHAFHSSMVDPILEAFRQQVAQLDPKPPRIPFLSNVTGTWIRAEEAVDPDYWVRHLRRPVQFEKCLETLFKDPVSVVLEVGPGGGLSALARRHPGRQGGLTVLASLPAKASRRAQLATLVEALHRLWLEGAPVKWTSYDGRRRHYRVPLPTYPFETKRFWIDPPSATPDKPQAGQARGRTNVGASDWFYVPSWERVPRHISDSSPPNSGPSPGTALVLGEATGLGPALVDCLEARGLRVTLVLPGPDFARIDERTFRVNPGSREDYHALLGALESLPESIFHLWNAGDDTPHPTMTEALDRGLERAFFSLLALAQALGMRVLGENDPITVLIAASGLFEVTGEEDLQPHKATLLGPALVIPLEYAGVRSKVIDLQWKLEPRALAEQLAAESASPYAERILAYRGRYRWLPLFKKVPMPSPEKGAAHIRSGGVYLITGGLGGLALAFAHRLVEGGAGTLILVGRRDFAGEKKGGPGPSNQAMLEKEVKLEQLRKMGVEVRVMTADAGDPEQMGKVVNHVLTRYGRLHGVIHAAGVATGGLMQTSTRDSALAHLRAKARGAAILDALLADTPLDFFLLCSSLASVMGNIGQAAYCAANAYLDAFATRTRHGRGMPTTAVNWDTWSEIGMAASGPGERPGTEGGIQTKQGLACFASILDCGQAQVLVATGDFASRWTRRHAQTAQSLKEHALPAKKAGGSETPRPKLSTPYVEPSGHEERIVARIFQQALGIAPVGAEDDFFELEGDSLLGTQVLARIGQSLRVVLPISSLFDNPTPRGLAHTIASGSKVANEAMAEDPERETEQSEAVIPRSPQAPPLLPVPRDRNLPLSYAQRRLWLLNQLRGPSSAYNMVSSFRVRHGLSLFALDRAIVELSLRHESLRTSFALQHGEPVQAIHSGPCSLLVVDTAVADNVNTDQGAAAWVSRAANLPFDLEKGPLFKAYLFLLGRGDRILMINMHHIISDAWSIAIIVRELTEIYGSLIGSLPLRLPGLPVQYADFAAWQRKWLEGAAFEKLLDYWRTQLAEVNENGAQPLARRLSLQAGHAAASRSFALDETLSHAIKTSCGDQGVTLFMYLLAAFQILVHVHTEEEDILVGTDIANRNHAGLERIVGFFVNQLALRSKIDADMVFSDFLRQVRTTALEAFAHQDMPFDRLVEALKPVRDPSRPPLFRMKFVLQNAPLPATGSGRVSLEPLQLETATAEYDLQVNMGETGSRLGGSFVYKRDYYDSATVLRLIRHFQHILRRTVENPAIRIGEFPAELAAADKDREHRQIRSLGRDSPRFGKSLTPASGPRARPFSQGRKSGNDP